MQARAEKKASSVSWVWRGYALVLAPIGLFLTVQGGALLLAGGSAYYVLAGLAVLASAVLMWRGDRRASLVYLALLAATVTWAIWEVGGNGWGLVARILAPTVLGLPLLAPAFGEGAGDRFWVKRIGAAAATLVAAAVLGAGLYAVGPGSPVDPMYQAGKAASVPGRMAGGAIEVAGGDWLHYGNDIGGTRFSPLDQITPANVSNLKQAWVIDYGPLPPDLHVSLEVTPLKVGESVFICTPNDLVIAADAETGRIQWRRNISSGEKPVFNAPCRGVAYYAAPNSSGPCAKRIITVSRAAVLVALDAGTGQTCEDFGDKGQVALLSGLSEAPLGYYYVSSAPQIVRGRIVIGGGVLDGQFYGEPSGVIRAWDAVTGKFAWAFDPGRPDQRGEPAPGQTYTPSTPNSWTATSADEKLGLVYLAMGSPIPDYYGGKRTPQDELYTDTVLALDAETGNPRWHFQTLRHDLWDYDVASQPTLIDLPIGGTVRQALVQPTKRGEIFVLDRATGKPIFPVTEHAVPQGGIVPGERLAKTQPFSDGMASFRGPDLRESDMWGVTPLDQLQCRLRFRKARYEGPLTPPGLHRPNLVYPGYLGGIDWGSVSIDADHGIMIVNSNRMPVTGQILTRAEATRRNVGVVGVDKNADPKRGQPQIGVPYAVDVQPFLSALGVPCNAPPFGLLTAVDLRTGKVIWNKPIGTARDSGPMGLTTGLPITMGLPNAGGSVTTRGGLVFIAAVQERTLRAFETTTGKEVWSVRLPGGGQATPMTYWSSKSGRQFVVIAAGGNVPLQSRISTQIVAYALPAAP